MTSCANPNLRSEVDKLLAVMQSLEFEVAHLDLNDPRVPARLSGTVNLGLSDIQEQLIVQTNEIGNECSLHSRDRRSLRM